MNLLNKLTFFLKLQIIVVIFLKANITYTQNCECNDASNELNLSESDSVKVFENINKLRRLQKSSCNLAALKLEFNYHVENNNKQNAENALNEQDQLYNTLDCKDEYRFDFLFNKTRYYRMINDFENLSDFSFKTLKEAERLKSIEKEIEAIQQIVYLFTRINEDEKNWSYVKRVENLVQKVNEPKLYVYYNRWLAYEFETKYTLTERSTLIDSALIFVNRAKTGAFKYNMNDEIAKFYRVQEACAYHKGDLEKALLYADSAIYYGKKIKGYKNLSGLYLSKAWDHLDLGQFEEANTWMDTSLHYNNERKTASSMMLYSEAAQIYEGSGEIEKAFKSYKLYSHLKDSILNIEKLEKINELEQKYLKAENEQKIVSLEKTKQFYMFIIIGSLLVILTIVFFFRQRSFKNKQRILETEQRLNRARINPHFFFNAMASLQSLSQQEKSMQTTIYTSRLAKIMRQSLENTYEELVTIENEIDFLKQYLEIQKFRFPNKFEYEFHNDDNLEINELKLPGMLTQPFVENAIEHGFKDIKYLGKIDIHFKNQDQKFNIIIEDNGKGINLDKNVKTHKSRAMQIIKDRLFLFNKQHNSNANYQILKTKDRKGLKIEIALPKLY